MENPSNVYRRFIKFEESAAAIYLQLASRFSKDPKLSSFWLDMAMQEKQHAGLLQFCLADGLLSVDVPDRSEMQINLVTKLFERLEKRASDPRRTV